MAAANSDRTELIVTRECQKPRIVDGLIAFPAQHDRLLTVILTLLRAAFEACECERVAIHQCVQIAAVVQLEELTSAVDQNVRLRLNGRALAGREADVVRRPITFSHFAGTIVGRDQTRRRLGLGPQRAHLRLDPGVTPAETSSRKISNTRCAVMPGYFSSSAATRGVNTSIFFARGACAAGSGSALCG